MRRQARGRLTRLGARLVTGPAAFLLAWVIDVTALLVRLHRRRQDAARRDEAPVG